ncbi:MAG: CZB domain-containing protein [Sulfurimonas sp.]|nr:CZB domain-containing protein [Sulfurimonas sp.]
MTKEEMVKSIEHAKEMHLEQMLKIEFEIDGKIVEKRPALGKMDCECGIWFHSHEKEMKTILGMQFFERLDKYHEEWHRSYANIYKMFEENEKKSLFSKLLGSSESEAMQRDKEKLYYSELQTDTQELLKAADAAIRRVSALKEDKFS